METDPYILSGTALEINNKLRTKLKQLEAEAKMGNIPYKEAIALKEQNKRLMEKIKKADEYLMTAEVHSSPIEITKNMYLAREALDNSKMEDK